MTLAVAEAVRGRRPTTVQGLSAALERARSQNHELRMEVRAAGQEMRAAGLAIQAALHNGPDDVAIHRTSARLVVRGEGYARR